MSASPPLYRGEKENANSPEVWDVMRSFARKEAIYGYEMMPRSGL